MKKTSLFENALIWFGAGVSIAEILTGTYLAPLGFKNGILAIVTGHIIGCVLLFLAGVIGGKKRLSAMDSTKMSFGQKGCLLFAALNVLQLVGWTAIMIYDGALAADGIMHTGSRKVVVTVEKTIISKPAIPRPALIIICAISYSPVNTAAPKPIRYIQQLTTPYTILLTRLALTGSSASLV